MNDTFRLDRVAGSQSASSGPGSVRSRRSLPAVRIIGVSRGWLRFLLPASVLTAVLGAGALAWAETEAVRSYWEGLWWSIALVTTVGFVGPIPTTATGKIVSSALMVLGFVLLAMTTAAVASLFVREDEISGEGRERRFERAVLAELGELRREVAQIRGDSQASADTDASGPGAEQH